jgi:hypothetical protein
MRSIAFIVLLGTVAFILPSASDLWSGSIYTWTDKNGMIHVTETPPPPGAVGEGVINNPPESPDAARPAQPQPSQSVWKWNLQRAEQQARQAQEELEAARQKAAEAEREARQTIQQSKEYIDSHDTNQYMRWAFRYKLRMAAEAAQAAQAKAQETADQVKKAEQRVADALQQVQGAREDVARYNPSE